MMGGLSVKRVLDAKASLDEWRPSREDEQTVAIILHYLGISGAPFDRDPFGIAMDEVRRRDVNLLELPFIDVDGGAARAVMVREGERFEAHYLCLSNGAIKQLWNRHK